MSGAASCGEHEGEDASLSPDMPLIQQDVPNRLSDLAVYASLVATVVTAVNVMLVKLYRRVTLQRNRFREGGRWRLRHR